MSLLTDAQLKTLDYAFGGQPAVDLPANANFPATGTLDYAVGGQPFIVGSGPAGTATISAAGIASAEQLGQPVVGPSIAAAGVSSTEALGSPAVVAAIAAAAVASAQALGEPTVLIAIECAGIPSSEAFGECAVTLQPMPSRAGTAILGGGPRRRPRLKTIPPHRLVAAGIESGEAFGRPTVQLRPTAAQLDDEQAWLMSRSAAGARAGAAV